MAKYHKIFFYRNNYSAETTNIFHSQHARKIGPKLFRREFVTSRVLTNGVIRLTVAETETDNNYTTQWESVLLSVCLCAV